MHTRKNNIAFAGRAIFALILCLGTTSLCGQRFQFGASGAALLSQVDGDHLRGFNKFGYSAGLVGGYSLNSSNWVVVQLQYSNFGSRQRDESDELKTVETNFNTINAFCGYALRFGDSWDGSRRFRLLVGPKIHSVQKAELDGKPSKSSVDRYFLSASASIGAFISRSMIVDLGYEQGLTTIVKDGIPGLPGLVPYYLSIGTTVYLFQ